MFFIYSCCSKLKSFSKLNYAWLVFFILRFFPVFTSINSTLIYQENLESAFKTYNKRVGGSIYDCICGCFPFIFCFHFQFGWCFLFISQKFYRIKFHVSRVIEVLCISTLFLYIYGIQKYILHLCVRVNLK